MTARGTRAPTALLQQGAPARGPDDDHPNSFGPCPRSYQARCSPTFERC